MILDTEPFAFTGTAQKPLSRELVAKLNDNADRYLAALRLWFFSKPPTYRPSEWLETAGIYLQIDATRGKSQADKLFSFTGREYLRDLIDQIEDPDLLFQTFCAGTGIGKTLRDYGIILYELFHNPFSGLYVMPALTGSGSAAEISHELADTMESSPVFAGRLPQSKSARKESLTRFKIEFGGNHLAFVGGQSTSKLGGKRCRLVFIGEQDKTKDKLGAEEGADYLAGERTKGMANSKIFRGSSPSMEGRAIWKALMGNGDNSGSDCRRRFLPCPHCNSQLSTFNPQVPKGSFVLIKDAQYNTALPLKFPDGTPIPFAEMRWDKEAKRRDGSWDMDRVIRSTRFECPHCAGHIVDKHRLWLDKNGAWIPTRKGEIGHAGFQLPSFYAPIVMDEFGEAGFKSTWGGMAQKFLNTIESGTIGGYINSDLAEVNAQQQNTRYEISTEANVATEDWTALMDCDFQKLYPYIWFVVSKWSSFKIHPPFPLSAGKPAFLDKLSPALRQQCDQIVGTHPGTWTALAEVLRFDPRTGNFPMLDFLIAKKITGPKLISLYADTCGRNTLDLGRWIYREMGLRLPKGGDSEVIAAGHAEWSGDEAWSELREIQQQFKVGENLKKNQVHPNRAVLVDSGYAEKNNPEVLRKCYESGAGGRFEFYDPLTKRFEPFRKHLHCRPVPLDSWIPYKGIPTDRPRKTAGIDGWKNWAPGDPFYGSSEAEKTAIRVLEAASDHYFRQFVEKRSRQKEIRAAIAAGKSYRGNVWNVANDCVFIGRQCSRREDFEAQLNSKGINSDGKIWERGTGGGGKRKYPDHLLDCVSQMAEAHAETLGFFTYERPEKQTAS